MYRNAHKDAVFTVKVERDLRNAFVDAAHDSGRTASQIMRDLMRHFVADKQRQRDYLNQLREKVDSARAIATDGDVLPPEVVNQLFRSMKPERET